MPQLSGDARRSAGPGYAIPTTGSWRCDLCGSHFQRAADPHLALEIHVRQAHPTEDPK